MYKIDYDLVIIGGGINGAGVAQAAAAMGYRALLLEKNTQLAAETSCRSSKLIHGGLRYLESFEFSLVRESLQERALLLKLAPQLVQLQRFNIPIYENIRRSSLSLHAGLSLYALLAGLQKTHFYHRIKAADWHDLDGLNSDRLKAVFQYHDAQTDDAALTRSVMASASALGAEHQCSAEFIGADIEPDHVCIQYRQQGLMKTANAGVLVNASGPWVYPINQLIHPQTAMAQPDLVQGTHLVLATAVQQAYYLEAPQDKRAVFLLPWKSHALLGTTEHLYHGDPAQVHMLAQEKDYLLAVYQHYFPAHDPTILQTMTGCRVLPSAGNNLSARSRETQLLVDKIKQPRLVSILGGKLTVYRRTAEKVMQLLRPSLPQTAAIADTRELPLIAVD